jgi:hypothetical protein
VNTPEPLLYYEMGRGYPVADDRLFKMIEKYWGGSSMAILASGHGLLGQRIVDFLGLPLVAIEADDQKIRDSKQHGVRIHTHHLHLTDDSMVIFKRLIDMHRVDILVTQNCLYDLAMGDDLRWDNWMLALQASEIYEIFIEDKHVTDCIVKLEALYHVAQRDGRCAYLARNQTKAPKHKPPA